MAEDLGIILKALVDQYSLKDIITQINDLSKKAVIKTDVILNDESLKKIGKSFDNIGEKVKNLSKITLFNDSNGKAFKQINELTNALGDIERKIYTLNKEGNLELSSTVEISNLKKQQEEYQKIINLLQRVENAKNKVYEDLESQYGFIDIKSLEKVDKSLNGINLDTENLFNNYKQVNDEVKKYEKQLQTLEGNALKQRQTIDYTQTIQQVKELENAEKELAKWKEEFSKKNINDVDYEILKQETLSKIKSDAIRQQLEEQVRLNAELDKQDTLEREIALTKQNLQNKLNDITVKNDKYDIEELNRLKEAIGNVTTDTPKAKLKLKELSSEISQFGIEAKKSSSTTNSFSDSLKRFLTFYSLHDVIRTTKIVVRELVDTVYDLAESLLEIQKVSDLTGNSLDSFVRQAYKIGDTLSKTGKDVIDATTIFKRAGYDLGNSTYLAKNAIVMQAVAENIRDVEVAGTSLLGILKGYGFEIEKATHVVDAFNQVSNTQATQFDTLVEGASRISAVMKQQGNSFEQMIGLLSGASEVLGSDSIERIATQLRTLSLRLASMNEETGKFEPEIVSKLNDEFERLAGISLVDENKQIKTTYEIMKSMAKVMPTLDKNTRSYLMELASGKRGMETMEAIMTNWKNVEKATNSAVNSYGSSADEFQKYTDSILGKTEKLKGALQELSITTLSDDFVGVILDATTSVVKLTTATGGLTPVVIGLVTAFSLLNAVKIKNTAIEMMTAFMNITTGAQSATVAITGLSLASKLLVGFGIVAGIMAIAYAFNKLENSAEESIIKTKQKISELNDEITNLNSSKTTFSDLAKEFRKLSDPISRTTEETKRFYEIQNQLHDLMPNLNGFYDEQNNFIVDENENLTSLNETYEKYIALKRQELSDTSKESAPHIVDDYEVQKNKLELLYQYLDYTRKKADGLLEATDDQQILFLQDYLGISFNKEKIEEEISKFESSISTSISTMQDDIRNQIMASSEWKKLGEDSKNGILKALSEVNESSLSTFSKEIANDEMSVKTFLHTMSNTQAFVDYMKSVEDAKNSTNGLEESVTTLSSTLEKLSGTRSNIEKLQSVLSNLDNGSLSASDMEELLGISEEFLPYLNDEIALRGKLNESITQYKTDYSDIYAKMISGSSEFYSTEILNNKEHYNTLETQLQDYVDNLNIGYDIDLDNWKTLEQAKIAITEQTIKKLAGGWSDYFNSVTGEITDNRIGWGGGALGSNLSPDFKKAQEDIKKYVANLDNIFNSVSYNGKSVDFNFDTSSSKNITDKWLEAFQNQYKEIQYLKDKNIISTQQYYDTLDSLNNKYFANQTKYLDEYRQYDLELYNLQKELADERIKDLEKQNQAIEDSLKLLDVNQSKYKTIDSEYKNITDQKYNLILQQEELLKKRVAELYKEGLTEEAEELEKTFVDLYQKRIELAKEYQSIEIDSLQNQIDTLEEQKSALESLHDMTMQMIKDELNARKESYQDEIDDIKKVFDAKKKSIQDEQDLRSYNKGLTEKTTVVADLENQLAIIKNDETAIAKRKELEKELADAKADLTDYQYDHSIEVQTDALDKEQELQTNALQDRIDEIDDTLSNEAKMRELTDKRIAKSGEKLYAQLIDYAEEYGTITEDEITTAWNTAGEAVDDFNVKQENLLDTLKLVADKLKEVNADLKHVESQSLDDYSSSIGTNTSYNKSDAEKHAKMVANSKAWTSASNDKKIELSAENQKLGKELGYTYDPVTGIWYKKNGMRAYHTGGIVGGSDYATKSTEELAKLLKGELVITPPQADKLMGMVTNNNTNNSESFSPTFMFNFEGQPNESLLEQFKAHGKEIAKMVAEEFDNSRINRGYKTKLKPS